MSFGIAERLKGGGKSLGKEGCEENVDWGRGEMWMWRVGGYEVGVTEEDGESLVSELEPGA